MSERMDKALAVEAEEIRRYNAYPRLVLALRNCVDAPTDDNGAAVRIELRRAARLLLAELGEVKVCQHGTGRITLDGWECAACGEKFRHDPLSPALAWPDFQGAMQPVPEFLKRKTS